MGASPPWRRGPQVRAALASWGPWGRRRRGTRDAARSRERPWRQSGVYTDRRKGPLWAVLGHLCTLLRRCGQTWRRRSVHRSARMAPWSRFGVFVYTFAMRVATRAASGGTSAPTAMACRRRPLGGRLPLGRKTASARAAPPLAWCLRRGSNPHKPPERHIFPESRIRRGFGSIRG